MDHALSVTEVSKIIKENIENNPELTSIWIRGELSNITYHSSGHIYLTLKDKNSILNGAFFKNANRSLKIKLEEGMSVIAFGSISIYERRGSYQLIVSQITPDGIGELQLQIEELKKKLLKEGLFDKDTKRMIPYLPKKVGVVTSPTGAAFRDILKVALRRYPNAEILLAPAKVQGEDAALTIAKGIEELNKSEWNVDVIIAGRGGGSFEDLMPFNEEIVVRAFAESKVPIISSVGHQIDHPLSDDAADQYAPTPSAAAEMIFPVKDDLFEKINNLEKILNSSLSNLVEQGKYRIENVLSRKVFYNPLEMIYLKEMNVEEMETKLKSNMKEIVSNHKQKLIKIPDLKYLISSKIEMSKLKYNSTINTIDQLSPLKTVTRGYSIALDEDGKIIKHVDNVNKDDKIELLLSDGRLNCTVDEVKKGESFGKEN